MSGLGVRLAASSPAGQLCSAHSDILAEPQLPQLQLHGGLGHKYKRYAALARAELRARAADHVTIGPVLSLDDNLIT